MAHYQPSGDRGELVWAYAYTQWLKEQSVTGPAGMPAGYVIRLPRECEWEKARVTRTGGCSLGK